MEMITAKYEQVKNGPTTVMNSAAAEGKSKMDFFNVKNKLKKPRTIIGRVNYGAVLKGKEGIKRTEKNAL